VRLVADGTNDLLAASSCWRATAASASGDDKRGNPYTSPNLSPHSIVLSSAVRAIAQGRLGMHLSKSVSGTQLTHHLAGVPLTQLLQLPVRADRKDSDTFVLASHGNDVFVGVRNE